MGATPWDNKHRNIHLIINWISSDDLLTEQLKYILPKYFQG